MKSKTTLLFILAFFLIGSLAFSQVLPYKRTGSLIVADTSNDTVYRLTDFNLDGDYNDLSEIIVFFDDGGAGVANPFKATADARGYVYVSDTTNDIIWRLIDLNGDGDAQDAGESNVYIDNTNLSLMPDGITPVQISAVNGITFDSNNEMWLVNAGSGGLDDFIALCRDGNNDGDCQDAGEILVHFEGLIGGRLGAPFGAIIAPLQDGVGGPIDDWLLVCDTNDAQGADSIFRFRDLNSDLDFYDAQESGYFYDEGLGDEALGSPFAMAVTQDGKLIINDVSEDNYYIAQDLDKDLNAHSTIGEMKIFRNGSADDILPDLSNGLAISGFGDYYWSVYAGESGSTSNPNGHFEGIHGMIDLNDDLDAEDPGEFADPMPYDDAVGEIALSNPKGLTFMRGPYLRQVGDAMIGQSFDLVMDGTFNDSYRIVWSKSTQFTVLPPMGILRVAPPRNTVGTPGTIGPIGKVTKTVNVPNNPNLVGKTFYFQGLCGTAYLRLLSNMVEITIQ